MKYIIVIALFVAPLYMANAASFEHPETYTSEHRRQVCGDLAEVEHIAGTYYQQNRSVPELRQYLEHKISDTNDYKKGMVYRGIDLLRKLYIGDVSMLQVGIIDPEMAKLLVKRLTNRNYAICMTKVVP